MSGLTLALFVVVRRRRGDPRFLAIVLLVSGVALVALPAWVAFRAEDRAVDEVAQVVARSAGISMEEATARVRTDPDLAVRTDTSGVWPSIAAGVARDARRRGDAGVDRPATGGSGRERALEPGEIRALRADALGRLPQPR